MHTSAILSRKGIARYLEKVSRDMGGISHWAAKGVNLAEISLKSVKMWGQVSQDTQPPLTPRQGLDYRGRVPDASP